jgi:hypothetical protein
MQRGHATHAAAQWPETGDHSTASFADLHGIGQEQDQGRNQNQQG